MINLVINIIKTTITIKDKQDQAILIDINEYYNKHKIYQIYKLK